MNVFFRRTILVLSFIVLLSFCSVWSQNEYRAEIGVQGGLNVYTGDINTVAKPDYFLQNMQNMQPDFGMYFRYRFNPRTALRLGYDYSTENGAYRFSDFAGPRTLDQQLHILDLTGEYNFFDLENNPYKSYSKKISPYIYAGLGIILLPDAESFFNKKYSPSVPFGFGVKWKITERWNLNVQWSNHFCLGDNLEGIKDLEYGELIHISPNGRPIWNEGIIPDWFNRINPMNNDLLSGLTLGISFDFWKKGCDCKKNGNNKKQRSGFQW
ncbi:MAG TPA: DUF6089 family protein [Paludibacteraceae bacterium]|nr:DUF6089 family protein [Paludibacteraceae bacterium]HPT43892.1 DUF6089 family protein [Paludibacteraceae bacterium]